MLTKSHLTIATALVVAAIAAPAATAMPADPTSGAANDLPAYPTPGDVRKDPRQADMPSYLETTGTDVAAPDQQASHASTVTAPDARGEHAASLADRPAVADLRTPDAVDPFVRPVVVEVSGEPAAPDFDWTAAIIGLAAGLAFAVLAGVAVSGGRRRHNRPRTV